MNQMEVVSELGVVYHQNHSLTLHLLTLFFYNNLKTGESKDLSVDFSILIFSVPLWQTLINNHHL